MTSAVVTAVQVRRSRTLRAALGVASGIGEAKTASGARDAVKAVESIILRVDIVDFDNILAGCCTVRGGWSRREVKGNQDLYFFIYSTPLSTYLITPFL